MSIRETKSLIVFIILFSAITLWHVVSFGDFEEEITTVPLEIPEFSDAPNRAWSFKQTVTDEDIYCMALNIYFEARGEPDKGKYAVSDVVMFRVQHANFPDDVCSVIKQAKYHRWNSKIIVRNKCHFSWFCDGLPDNPIDGNAFDQAMDIATDVLTNPYYKPTVNALYYHAEYVEPYWAESHIFLTKIGIQLFYM